MRSRLLVVAALVVVVAVACAVVVRALDDDTASTPAGLVVESGTCPEVTDEQRTTYVMPDPLPGAPDTIADGATRVWLCQGPGAPLDVPADALLTGADAVAHLVNALPTTDPDEPQACASDGGPGYRLRFGYRDGTVADAVGELYGCGNVQVGPTMHAGDRGGVALQEFIRLLRAQRALADPPDPPEQPSCVYDDETVFGPISPVARADEMVAASLCVWDGRGIGGPADHVAVVPATDLATLMADYPLNLSDRRPTGRECRAGRQLAIQGVTAWGDRVLMSGSCSVIQVVGTRPTAAADGATAYWRPGPEARAILDRLLGTDPMSVAACPAGPDIPLEAEATDAAPGTIAAGASSVRLCLGPGVGFQEPADALVTDVGAVVDAVNSLEPLDLSGGCTGEMGIGYRLVFGYPDGTAADAVGELYGCETVTAGDVVLGGSETPWDVTRERLREQRAATRPPPAGFGPTCRAPSQGQRDQISPVAAPRDMSVAVLCVMAVDGSEATRRSRMTQDALLVLLEDRAAHTDEGEPSDVACDRDRRVFTLRGVTRWGDRVEMTGLCGLVMDPGQFPDDAPTYWHPGRDARKLLDRLYDAAEPLRRIG